MDCGNKLHPRRSYGNTPVYQLESRAHRNGQDRISSRLCLCGNDPRCGSKSYDLRLYRSSTPKSCAQSSGGVQHSQSDIAVCLLHSSVSWEIIKAVSAGRWRLNFLHNSGIHYNLFIPRRRLTYILQIIMTITTGISLLLAVCHAIAAFPMYNRNYGTQQVLVQHW